MLQSFFWLARKSARSATSIATMAGLVPQVIGLRLDDDGNPVGPDQTTDPDTPRPPGLVVTDVEILDPPLDRHTHVHADPETGAIDVTEVTP